MKRLAVAAIKRADADNQRLTDWNLPRCTQFPRAIARTALRRCTALEHQCDLSAWFNPFADDDEWASVEILTLNIRQRGVGFPRALAGVPQRNLAFVVGIDREYAAFFTIGGILRHNFVIVFTCRDGSRLLAHDSGRCCQRLRPIGRRCL